MDLLGGFGHYTVAHKQNNCIGRLIYESNYSFCVCSLPFVHKVCVKMEYSTVRKSHVMVSVISLSLYCILLMIARQKASMPVNTVAPA